MVMIVLIELLVKAAKKRYINLIKSRNSKQTLKRVRLTLASFERRYLDTPTDRKRGEVAHFITCTSNNRAAILPEVTSQT